MCLLHTAVFGAWISWGTISARGGKKRRGECNLGRSGFLKIGFLFEKEETEVLLHWKLEALKKLSIDFKRERETSICCSTYLCIHWLLLICALPGDWTRNFGVSGMMLQLTELPGQSLEAVFNQMHDSWCLPVWWPLTVPSWRWCFLSVKQVDTTLWKEMLNINITNYC